MRRSTPHSATRFSALGGRWAAPGRTEVRAALLLAGAALALSLPSMAGGCTYPRNGNNVLGETTAGGSGGQGGSGGAGVGGQQGCDFDTDCPGVETACERPRCVEKACGTFYQPVGTACMFDGGAICDGNGACIDPLGEDCSDDPTVCKGAYCVDGICCNTPCDGGCESCNQSGAVGTCTPTGSAGMSVSCDPAMCDGSGACADGEEAWMRTYGNGSHGYGYDVAVTSNGDAIVTGGYQNYLNVIGLQPGSSQGIDGLVMRMSATGAPIWAVSATDANDGDLFAQNVFGVAVSDSDRIFVGGDFVVTLKIGTQSAGTAAGGFDLYLAELDGNGEAQWIKSFGSTTTDRFNNVVMAPNGDVIVTGTVTGDLTVDNKVAMAAGGTDMFVAAIDPSTQQAKWARSLGGTGDDRAEDVVVLPNGNVVVVGSLFGTLLVGGETIGQAGNAHAVIFELSGGDGSVVRAAAVGGSSNSSALGVAADGDGNVYAVGFFDDDATFGETLSLVDSGNSQDGFVARLNGMGEFTHAVGFGIAGSGQALWDVALDSRGNVLLAGVYFQAPMFAGTTLPDSSKSEAFVGKMSSSLTGFVELWGYGVASNGGADYGDWFTGIAVDAEDNVIFSGSFGGDFDFGGVGYGNTGGGDDSDMMVLKVGP